MSQIPFGFFPRRRLFSAVSGGWPANPAPGGAEFEAFREARAGEDVRWIDWLGSRRSGEKLVRLAEEARAPGLLWMVVGHGGESFRLGELVISLVKLLSEEIVYSDPESRIGLVAMLGSKPLREPMHSGSAWRERILTKLEHALRREEVFGGELFPLREAGRPWLPSASTVVLLVPISRLFLDDDFAHSLSRLRAPGREVILFALAGRWELRLPSVPSSWTFRDSSGSSLRVPLGSRRFRERFASHASARLRELSGRLASLGFRRTLEWEVVQEGDSLSEQIRKMAALRRRILA
ncbi:hypothetical protein MAMC_00482 [Methylacidimicrobium cyclopophantes]|uniref:DUF58 domain-containing protein n=1 Tax=Methylacidimicrobium cyclopophantes TaxID=1041766 RepID=A0A5E6MBU2_9BACT|nr:DUF58 domain-containing protein [Methylacidimicrobium cyclopophantes]VVM05250.1 hypothetical protein MAMC_00482 [Methylacidimicrobium cyclopophantes]